MILMCFFSLMIFNVTVLIMKVKIHQNFTNIKVATFNCRGLNDTAKRAAIFEYFMNSDVTIICLQETKLSPEKEMNYVREWT